METINNFTFKGGRDINKPEDCSLTLADQPDKKGVEGE